MLSRVRYISIRIYILHKELLVQIQKRLYALSMQASMHVKHKNNIMYDLLIYSLFGFRNPRIINLIHT